MRAIQPAILAIGLLALLLAAVLGGMLFIYLGVYNVSALAQHTQPVYQVIDTALHYSVQQRAEELNVPDLEQDGWSQAGLALYKHHCRQCHGAPGVAPEHFALGMKPVPTAMVEAARKRSPAELFWVIEHGIKMTGMPAWKYRLSERQMWQIVAFLQRMPYLSVPEYRQLAAAVDEAAAQHRHDGSAERRDIADNAVERGRVAIQQHGCISCHSIPGITGAEMDVGPPLAGIASRTYIAGVLTNTTENMVRWIRFPQEIDPLTAMPPLGVSEQDARDIAAYLDQLRRIAPPTPLTADMIKPAPFEQGANP